MIATALDRLEARLSPARFPKPESVPQVEAPSLAYADITHEPRRPSRNPGQFGLAVIEGIFGCVRVWRERGRTRRNTMVNFTGEVQAGELVDVLIESATSTTLRGVQDALIAV